jgi:5-formyltetrahydrofolate cyclo-ligase
VKGLNKDEWRKELRARRKALSADDRAAANKIVTTNVLVDPAVAAAKCVHVYLSTAFEVSTAEIIRTLIDRGVTVIVPWMNDDGSMGATRLEPADLALITLARRRGVPSAPVLREVDLSTIDVVLVPLLGFDLANQRIGMGAGHYDRFLSSDSVGAHRGTAIGLAFDCQRVVEVPTEPHDIALARIICG